MMEETPTPTPCRTHSALQSSLSDSLHQTLPPVDHSKPTAAAHITLGEYESSSYHAVLLHLLLWGVCCPNPLPSTCLPRPDGLHLLLVNLPLLPYKVHVFPVALVSLLCVHVSSACLGSCLVSCIFILGFPLIWTAWLFSPRLSPHPVCFLFVIWVFQFHLESPTC